MREIGYVNKAIERLKARRARFGMEIKRIDGAIGVLEAELLPAEPEKPEVKKKKGVWGRNKFKGVKKCRKGYADGRDRYAVQFYNKETKRVEHIGIFDNEEAATRAHREREKQIRGDFAEHAEKDLHDRQMAPIGSNDRAI